MEKSRDQDADPKHCSAGKALALSERRVRFTHHVRRAGPVRVRGGVGG